MPLVVDASVAMAWCFEDEATDETDAILDRLGRDGALVPSLWPYELTNVLAVAERRERLTGVQAARFLDLVAQLPIRVDDLPTDPAALGVAARHHALSAYDAAYLVLAERLGVPLATLDGRLATASRNAGVEVLGVD